MAVGDLASVGAGALYCGERFGAGPRPGITAAKTAPPNRNQARNVLARRSSCRRASPATLLLCLLATPGCREEGIRSYTVPPLPQADGASADGADRMLAAIVPGGGQAWFFKLVAPAGDVAPIADDVQTFFQSITVDETTGKPQWRSPKGWEDGGPSGMRLTTLRSPGGLELTVTGLTASDDWDAGLLSNVNRWRGQLGLGDLTAGELAEQSQPLEAAGQGAIAVDFTGQFEGGGMAAPFAGRGLGGPPMTPPRARSQPAVIAYDTPEGWIEKPASAMRLATLKTGDSDAAAEAVASVFPSTGVMGDVAANVNRWRSQVGLQPVDGDALNEVTETISIAGGEAAYTEAVGDESAIFAAMLPRAGSIYFFKLTAQNAAEAVANRDAFKAWIESVRFDGGGGDENQDPDEGE